MRSILDLRDLGVEGEQEDAQYKHGRCTSPQKVSHGHREAGLRQQLSSLQQQSANQKASIPKLEALSACKTVPALIRYLTSSESFQSTMIRGA